MARASSPAYATAIRSMSVRNSDNKDANEESFFLLVAI